MKKYVIQGQWVTLNEYINAERSNRFKAASIKRNEMERMMWQIGSSKIEGKINLRLQAYVKDRKKDTDNLYTLFLKFFLDALVEKGVIENDGQKQIGQIIFEAPQLGEERMEVSLQSCLQ